MENFELPQRIYRRHELPIADYLMSFQDALREEFLKGEELNQVAPAHDDTFDENTPKVIVDYLVSQKKDGKYVPEKSGWKNKIIKYTDPEGNVQFSPDDNLKNLYPTACKLVEEYGDDCHICNYSILGPHSSINRHTGPENRTGEYIRIHIPLIVPEGDIFFEVFGEEIDWSDIFAFNNQFCHSAYNNSDDWRLCFLIDIRRTTAGLPPGAPYDIRLEQLAKPFVRHGERLTYGPMPMLEELVNGNLN
jgi:hypothetical protein